MAILILFLACAASLLGADGRTPVLVELFTSEGCSSCPPADRFLEALDQRQPVQGVDIIVLSEHVDYWDGEGWRDPFGSFQFTARQRDYSSTLHTEVYTPQMVLDGKTGFVGNQTSQALAEIAKLAGRPSATVHFEHLTTDGGLLAGNLSIQGIPAEAGKGPFEVYLAVTESGLHSRPDTGENKGAALSHAGVVRSLVRLGKPTATGFDGDIKVKIQPSWKLDSVKLVAFLQDKKTHIVWGVGRASLQ